MNERVWEGLLLAVIAALVPLVFAAIKRRAPDLVDRIDRAVRSGHYWRKDMSAKMDQLVAEVTPNGGGRMRDEIRSTRRDIRAVKAAQRARGNSSIDGEFEADEKGLFTQANATFLRITERSEDDLRGMRWLSSVAERDRDEVRSEWRKSIEEGREFRMQFVLFGAVSGNEASIICTAIPMVDGNDVFGWAGNVRRRDITATRPAIRPSLPYQDNGS